MHSILFSSCRKKLDTSLADTVLDTVYQIVTDQIFLDYFHFLSKMRQGNVKSGTLYQRFRQAFKQNNYSILLSKKLIFHLVAAVAFPASLLGKFFNQQGSTYHFSCQRNLQRAFMIFSGVIGCCYGH
jgi:hypothetical protein